MLELKIPRAQAMRRISISEMFLGPLESTIPENSTDFDIYELPLAPNKAELANTTESLLSINRHSCFSENVASVRHGNVYSHYRQLRMARAASEIMTKLGRMSKLRFSA